MAKLKVNTGRKDTGQRTFRELKERETFLFADHLYVKAKADEFYGKVVAMSDGVEGDRNRREMNCFCLSRGTFGSFRSDTIVERVKVKTIEIDED